MAKPTIDPAIQAAQQARERAAAHHCAGRALAALQDGLSLSCDASQAELAKLSADQIAALAASDPPDAAACQRIIAGPPTAAAPNS